MDVWIRTMTGWEHRARLPALSYELPLWSANFTDGGSVTVPGEINDCRGDWLIAGGRPYVITGCAPKNGVTAISVKLPESAFSRPLVYTGGGTERYGEFIAAVLADEFADQSDPVYALPYLTVSNLDTTIFSFPTAAGEVYTLLDVITAAAAAGVYLTWTPDVSGLSVAVSPRAPAEHTVIMGNGHYQLVGQAYTSDIVAKATVRLLDKESGEVLDQETYYWQHDGTVDVTPPTPRIEGEWVQLSLTGEAESAEETDESALAEAAADAMADNTAAYKVEFYADREDLRPGDTVRCRIGEILTEGVLSYAKRSSRDKRILYRAGTAATTLTEKVSRRSSGGGRASASRGSSGAPGVTFTPVVSQEGVISWSNDGGLPNPEPVNIKGPQGDTGGAGATGPRGPQGVSVDEVTLVSGTHAPGTTDTYSVDLDDGTSAGTFTVYNGADGDGPGGAFSLLWENPSPTSSFAAQTVTVGDMSGFDCILIEYIFSTGSPDLNARTYPVAYLLAHPTVSGTLQINAAGYNRCGARSFELTSATTVHFSAAGYNGTATNNGYAVPQRIHGIKY